MPDESANLAVGLVYVSKTGIAHLPGRCMHQLKKNLAWGIIDQRGAWEAIGKGQQIQATGGRRPELVATSRCSACAKPFLEQEARKKD